MLICLYGEMREALWPEHGLSEFRGHCALGVAFLPAVSTTRALQNISRL
jgi:hypothetical protein